MSELIMLGCMEGSFEIVNRVYSTEGIAPTINTCGGGGREPKILTMETVNIKQNTKQGYIECEVGGVADLSFPDSKTRRGRVIDNGNTSPTLQTGSEVCRIEKDEHNKTRYRIRKLTPKECFRLMNFDDSDFYAAESVNSNTQLYKQAGNSIVVNCLCALFSQLGLEGVPRWNEMTSEQKQELSKVNVSDDPRHDKNIV